MAKRLWAGLGKTSGAYLGRIGESIEARPWGRNVAGRYGTLHGARAPRVWGCRCREGAGEPGRERSETGQGREDCPSPGARLKVPSAGGGLRTAAPLVMASPQFR